MVHLNDIDLRLGEPSNKHGANYPLWVNGRFLTQRLSGVQRYAYEISKRIRANIILPARPREEYQFVRSDNNPVFLVRSKTILGRSISGHVWEQFILPNLLLQDSLLWSPGGLGPLKLTNQALTIHDIAMIEHPEWYGRAYSFYYRLFLPAQVRRVRAIFAVSEFTKRWLISRFRIPSEKVFITPNGIDRRFRILNTAVVDRVLGKFGLAGIPYILAVSVISPRKNIEGVYKAWRRLSLSFPDLMLVVVGRIGARFSGRNAFTWIKSQNVIHLGEVSDIELIALYNGAKVFVYPSLYEGFGIPPLEAMACGTPVVTSNSTALPEVVGDAALLVNPLRVEEIVRAIELLLRDEDLRDELVNKGLKRAKLYDWDVVSKNVESILYSML